MNLVVQKFMNTLFALAKNKQTCSAAKVTPFFAFEFSLLDKLLGKVFEDVEIVEKYFFFVFSFRFNIDNQIR